MTSLNSFVLKQKIHIKTNVIKHPTIDLTIIFEKKLKLILSPIYIVISIHPKNNI